MPADRYLPSKIRTGTGRSPIPVSSMIVNIQGSQQQVNNALQAKRRLLMIVSSDDDGEDSLKIDGENRKRSGLLLYLIPSSNITARKRP
jgi:hypothetical protein